MTDYGVELAVSWFRIFFKFQTNVTLSQEIIIYFILGPIRQKSATFSAPIENCTLKERCVKPEALYLTL